MFDFPRRLILSWVLGLCVLIPGAGLAAEPFKARVQLAWGTDGEKPAGKNFSELDGKTREKLRHLRWKHYWVVKEESPAVTSESKRLSLSEKCLVELKDLGNGNLEVKLFAIQTGGEVKFVKTVQHSVKALKDGEFCIIAGDDKKNWEDAWLVVISRAP